MRIKSFLAKLLSITSLAVLTGGCNTWAISSYDKVPIDLAKAGSVSTTQIKINNEDTYVFFLAFDFDREGKKYLSDIPVYKELHNFLRDYRSTPPGEIIPVRLTVNKADNKNQQQYHDGVYDTAGLNSWNDNAVYRKITSIRLPPGRYSVRLESLKDISNLPKSKVTLEIRRFYKK